MDENKTTEEEKTEEPVKAEDAGIRADTNRTVDDINLAAKRAEEASEKLKIENDRKEYNYARMQKGGGSEAGSNQAPTFSDEEKASRKRIKAVADASGSSWGKKYE